MPDGKAVGQLCVQGHASDPLNCLNALIRFASDQIIFDLILVKAALTSQTPDHRLKTVAQLIRLKRFFEIIIHAQFFAMTMLDENRARFQIAKHTKKSISDVVPCFWRFQ